MDVYFDFTPPPLAIGYASSLGDTPVDTPEAQRLRELWEGIESCTQLKRPPAEPRPRIGFLP